VIFGKVVERKICLLTCVQHLSENVVILRRTERDTIISIHRSSCKVPVILVRFYGNVNLIDRVSSSLIIKFHENSSVGSPVFPCGQTGATKLMVAFSNFVNTPHKN
jgi:hypothetical protein